MNMHKEDKRIVKTKKLIKRTIIELMREKEVQNITVTDIAEKAEINRGTFYMHYQDIYSLADEIENDILGGITEILENASKLLVNESTEKPLLLIKLLECFYHNRDSAEIFLGGKGYISFQLKLKYILINGLYEIIRLNIVKTTDPSGFGVIFIATGLIGIIQEWVQSGFKKSPEEIAQIFMDIKGHYVRGWQ